MKKICLLSIMYIPILTFAQNTVAAFADKPSEVWVPDNGDGTYKNPIIYADYSDLEICRRHYPEPKLQRVYK